MKKKQKILIVIGIIVGILSVTGVSFALWSKTFFQTGDNTIASDCFQIVFLEDSGTGINLENSFPMFDSEGKRLTPYTFSITNTCDSAVEYQLNLETTNQTTMKDSYIKVMLNEETPALLSAKTSTTPTITNGKSAYILESGTLSGNTKNEYTLRIWMDEHVTQNDEGAMNSLFESKITITGSYVTSQQPLKEYGIKEFVIAKGTGLYEVNHENAEITSDLTEEQKANLKKTEYRYAGSNPNNYVKFNDELWRIIGLVNTSEGQRIKLIHNEGIGNYSWDSSASVHGGYGINEWSQADIMTVLNHGVYYNRSAGTCYNGLNDSTTPCDFTATGLTEKAKTMIDTITWNLGTNGNTSTTAITALEFYNHERSNNTGKVCTSSGDCNDTIERTTLWSGKVGLMYPSDYGYATSGGSTTNRLSCLTSTLYSWSDENKKDCKNNDWLNNSNLYQWTMTPAGHSSIAYLAYRIGTNGNVSTNGVVDARLIRPTIYLKENIKFTQGDGSVSNPYWLS